MIAKPPTLSFLQDLQMPLRDALRGVATLADATEDALEPAAQLFPEPLRSRFRHALEALEQAGKGLTHSPIATEQIETASRFLTGEEADMVAGKTCARVLVYGWEHLHEGSANHRHMISETIVADRMRRARSASSVTGFDFAAAVLAAVEGSSAISLMPGLTRSSSAEEKTETDLALLTIGVWLLTRRAESIAGEEKLLDLSMALVRALQTDAETDFADARQLSRFLADTSAHL
jgi:hypothetical protein